MLWYSKQPISILFSIKRAFPARSLSGKSKPRVSGVPALIHGEFSDKLKRAFYQTHIGETHDVLFEHENDNGFMNGYTSNYIRVRIPYKEDMVGKIAKVRLMKLSPLLYIEGEIIWWLFSLKEIAVR